MKIHTMNFLKPVIICLAVLLTAPAVAEEPALANLFKQLGVDGTIAISSLKTQQTFIHNDARAKLRFPTASTFKIMNTLIALEEKLITGKGNEFKWDGHIYGLPNWNHDQSLESAFKVSCVWCYQMLASQISTDKYLHYLKAAEYGELVEPFGQTTFWLDGSLKISALEQVGFIRKVYLRTLPFRASSYDTLRQIMLVEDAPKFKVFAKTGWAARATPQIGWYVGYVETAKDVWFFATNMDIPNETALPLRQKLTQEALRVKGIIE